MLPKYLKIHGYRSYVDAEINFSDFGNLFCLIGENGAGKSSIIEMITTALYYRNSCTDNKGAGMDEMINHDCDHFELQFCFEMNGTTYLIISRKYRNGPRELEFYIDGISQTEKILETQKKIIDVIKLDYDVFLDTICVGQGMSARFMNKKPNERKETLAQILDIKKYEAYEKEAKETRKLLKTQIDNLNSQIEFASTQYEDVNVLQKIIDEKTEKNIKLKKNLEQLNNKFEIIIKEKAEYESLIGKNKLILNQRSKLKNQLSSLKNDIELKKERYSEIEIENIDFDSEIQQLQKEIDKKREEITSIKEEMSRIKTENNFFEQEKKKIKEKHHNLESYNKSICDFCGNEITPEHKEKHLIELKETYKETNVKISKNNDSLDEFKKRGSKLSEDGKLLSNKKQQLQDKKNKNEKLKHLKESLENEISFLQKSLDEYQVQYDENLKINIVDVEQKTFNDNELRREISQVSSEISENEQSIAVTKSQIDDISKNEKLLNQLNQQLAQLNLEFGDYDSVSIAFGKKGIQKSIIKKDLPNIESEINNVLQLLSDNAMSIRFETDKKGNKKDIDTLDIIIHDGINSRSYETYSGGEKFRIDFSCHIGLAKFLTKRAGATIDFFIIDEGLGSQDSSARQKFIDTLHKISKIFKQVMCITHINELQDSFDTKVLIEKDPIRGSQISIL